MWIMSLVLLTGPTLEPLTVAQLASHLRIDIANLEPAPHVGPTPALVAATPGNVDTGTHRWAVSYVDLDEGETEPSPLSSALAIADKAVAGQVDLTAIPTGGSRIAQRKIWRTKANASVLFLVTTIQDNTTTSYRDNVADGSLGAQAPTANTTGDADLAAALTDARFRVEDVTGRQLLEAEYRLDLWGWPAEGFIEVPRPPCLSVRYIKYVASDGTLTTLARDQYQLERPVGPRCGAAKIWPAYGVSWPTVREQCNAVQVTFTAGYGCQASDVPGTLTRVIRNLAGTMYEQRENDVLEKNTTALPEFSLHAQRILKPYLWRPTTRQAA